MQNITWEIDPTQNYPPIVAIISPLDQAEVDPPTGVQINFSVSEPNGDNTNVSLYLTNGGTLHELIQTGMNQSNTTYTWTNTTIAYDWYNLTLEACELGTPDLFCHNDTHNINYPSPTPPDPNAIKGIITIHGNNKLQGRIIDL